MRTMMILLVMVGLLVDCAWAQDEVAAWPQFRGPGGLSVAGEEAIPLDFGPGKRVLWKTELPAGHSSPCVYGERIVLTGHADGRDVVVGIDRGTGAVLWRRSFEGVAVPEYSHVDAVPALPTPCTDGERVFAYLATYGLVALDLDGQVLWEKRMPHPGNGFGVGLSPLLADGKVILVRDGAPEAAIFAFDAEDGSEAWKIDRFGFIESHGSPFLWKNAGRTELVVTGTSQVRAFDPSTGDLLWNVNGVTVFNCTTATADAETLYFAGWSTGNSSGRSFWEAGFGRSLELSDAEVDDPRLLFRRMDANSDGILVPGEIPECRFKDAFGFLDHDGSGTLDESEMAGDDSPNVRPGKNVMMAIARGGSGDVTESHVRWKWSRGLPYVASPLLYRGRIWLVKAGGMVSCLDAESGERILDRERLDDRSEYYMSPVGAFGHVILGSAEGTLYILKADGDELQIVHQADFGEGLFATPAILEGKVYLRTEHTLWAFGS